MSKQSGKGLAAATCLLLVFVSALAPPARAQAVHEGRLTGTVAGEDQAVLPGALIASGIGNRNDSKNFVAAASLAGWNVSPETSTVSV